MKTQLSLELSSRMPSQKPLEILMRKIIPLLNPSSIPPLCQDSTIPMLMIWSSWEGPWRKNLTSTTTWKHRWTSFSSIRPLSMFVELPGSSNYPQVTLCLWVWEVQESSPSLVCQLSSLDMRWSRWLWLSLSTCPTSRIILQKCSGSWLNPTQQSEFIWLLTVKLKTILS